MDNSFVETISHEGIVLAIIVRNEFRKEGIHFFTPNEYSQQLGYMSHPKGKIIDPHIHKKAQRKINYTQETLFIRKGSMQVDFFSEDQNFLESQILHSGDVILLIKGGHGFKVLEDLEMFEVKQGPYAGDEDKIRFSPH